jgi:CRP/FNR family transcriptional regulator, cyclic AMP receptor protein
VSPLEEARAIAARHGWLTKVPAPFRDVVLANAQLVRLAPGGTLYRAGDTSSGIFGLTAGALRVALTPNAQGAYFAHFLRPGSWFGELPLLTGRPRIVGISAARASDVLHLPRRAIDALLRDQPEAWRWIAFMAIEHFQTAVGVASDLMIRDATERFIAVLIRLGGYNEPAADLDARREIDVSQDDLAAMANLGRTKVSAILNRLAAEGAVELTYRCITVVAARRLQAIVQS